MKSLVKILACAALLLATAASQANTPDRAAEKTWWHETPWVDPDRGFNWYPDPKEEAKPEKKAEKKEEKPKTLYEMTTLEEIKKELDRLKGVAVVNPTEANVLEFLRAQNWVMDKSSLFADVSRRVVWSNPEVNYAARSPVANFSRANEKNRVDKRRDEVIKNLAETHGILFFARSDCDFCHDQAPVLKGLQESTGLRILTVTLDGKPIPMFPDAKPDNGIAMMVSEGRGIQMVPAMFLLDRKTQQVIPLGTGVVARDDLLERIRVLTSTTPGQEF